MSAYLAAPRHTHSELHKELLPAVSTDRGRTRFPFDLPMPGMARLRLSDQSMIMAALDNALNNRAIQRDFANDPVSGAAHTYLSLETMSL